MSSMVNSSEPYARLVCMAAASKTGFVSSVYSLTMHGTSFLIMPAFSLAICEMVSPKNWV